MLFNTLSIALALFTALASASPIAPRDFNCNVENVRCCEQVLTQHEAARQLGGLLVLPGDLIGNVGLSCSVNSLASNELQIRLTCCLRTGHRHQRFVKVQEQPCLLLASVSEWSR